MKKILVSILFCSVALMSCKREGCTDETAMNYDEKAKVEDLSCTYYGDPYIGTYVVEDSLYQPMYSSITTVYQKITIVGSDESTLYLPNYQGTDDELYLEMSGSTFTIPAQEISGGLTISGSGFFRNDSLFYVIAGDDYDNRGSGGKF